MKCSICGKEFGNGANCKNCGTDRVTGLGNYSGYDTPSNSSGKVESSSSRRENPQQIVDNEPKIVKLSSMICHACGEIIPADSKFCPHCSTSLYVTCPKCGHEYSSQYPACNKCGMNRDLYYEQERRIEAEKQRAIRREQERLRKQREWEQSPEGQAEIARRKKAEEEKKRIEEEENKRREEVERKGRTAAEEIRKEFSSHYIGYRIWGWICVLGTIVLFFRLCQIERPEYVDIFLPFIWLIGTGICYVISINLANSKMEEEIRRWKNENPDNIATPYLTAGFRRLL